MFLHSIIASFDFSRIVVELNFVSDAICIFPLGQYAFEITETMDVHNLTVTGTEDLWYCKHMCVSNL